MIDYEEDWKIWTLVFRWEGSVALKSCIYAIPAAVLSILIVIFSEHQQPFREFLDSETAFKSQMWTATTAVLLLLIGFRTKNAYSRFWEATGLLHQMRGEWFDSVSCCVTFSRTARVTKPQQVEEFRHTIVRLMSLCHGSALEEIAGDEGEGLETIDAYGLDDKTLQHLKKCKETYNFNRVEVLLHLTQSLITKSLSDGVLDIAPPILSRVYQTLSRGFVNLLNAKKITDTKFPLPYVQVIAMLLLVHVILVPLQLAIHFESKIWAPLFTFVPVFGMFSLNFVAAELENPFGDDANDLPLEHFQHEMNNCLMMLLQDDADLISGTSKRCIMNFSELKDAMRISAGGTFRISNFTDSSSEGGRQASIHSRLTSNWGSEAFEHGDIQENEVVNRHPLETKDPSEIVVEGPFGSSEYATDETELANMPVSPQPWRWKAIARTTNPAELDRRLEEFGNAVDKWAKVIDQPKSSIRALSTSLDEFNSALQSWTRMMEDQVSELSQNLVEMKQLGDGIPAVLGSMQRKTDVDEATLKSLIAFPSV